MRLGIFGGDTAGRSIDDVVEEARAAEADGFASFAIPQIFGLDAMGVLAVVGRAVPRITLATGVVPTYGRHPATMAQQALTVQEASGGRFVLGIGLSHQIVIENMFGYSFDKPARHMKEYLQALLPLLAGEAVNVQGETLKAVGQLSVAGAARPPVLLAALAPTMLKLAGGVADGTVTWMTGPATVANHIVPSISAAAEAAGRAAPRTVVALPTMVTSDVDGAKERAAKVFVVYGGLPSYRAMLDREGAAGPADVVIAGDEATVRKAVDGIRDSGATDFVAVPFGTPEENARTLAVVKG